MPNNVYNGLVISGDEAKVEEIFEKHFPADEDGEHRLDFNTLIPYPEEYKKQDEIAEKARAADPPDRSVKDGYNMGGYDWCINNWGTKWNAYDQEVTYYEGYGQINAEFYTAWSPPSGALARLCELYPDVEITASFEEAGMGFEGVYENQNGTLVETYANNNSKRILRGG